MSINLTKYILPRRRPARPRRSSARSASLVKIHPEAPFARFVRDRRCQRGLSVYEAADFAGYDLMRWCRLELGLWVPDQFEDLWRIAAVLNCNWEQISSAIGQSGGLH